MNNPASENFTWQLPLKSVIKALCIELQRDSLNRLDSKIKLGFVELAACAMCFFSAAMTFEGSTFREEKWERDDLHVAFRTRLTTSVELIRKMAFTVIKWNVYTVYLGPVIVTAQNFLMAIRMTSKNHKSFMILYSRIHRFSSVCPWKITSAENKKRLRKITHSDLNHHKENLHKKISVAV